MGLFITPGSATANSYVSVASANSYMQFKEDAQAWNDVTDNASTGTLGDQRVEDLLKQSTREIDNTFRFHNSKYYNGIVGQGQEQYQSLEFPRTSNVDADNNLIIPDEVKFATYEQALWILQRGGIKTNPETGFEFQSMLIGKRARNFLKGWVNRQITKTGNWPHEGSDY